MTDFKSIASSFTDPNGRLFFFKDELYRGIYKDKVTFYRNLTANPLIKSFIAEGKLVKTDIIENTEQIDPDTTFGMVFKHQQLRPVNYCFEWSPSMFKEAALLTLEMNLKLSEQHLMLQDASPWNIIFKNTSPVFVDFTSIVEESKRLVWPAYDQFCRVFLFPLYLIAKGRAEIARALLLNPHQGVSARIMAQTMPLRRKITPSYISRIMLPNLLGKMTQKPSIEKKMLDFMETSATKMDMAKARIKMTRSLIREVKRIKFKKQITGWSDYQDDLSSEDKADFIKKQEIIERLIKQTAPASVIDLGSNQGLYSFIAAANGAKVIAMDADLPCIEDIYQQALNKKAAVLPLFVDLANPAPAYGWCHNQFSSTLDRFSADLVLSLALIHHLAFTFNHNFTDIVDLLSRFTTQWLVVEFVPKTDEKSRILLSRKDDIYQWYTRENFAKELETKFTIENRFPLAENGRELFLCKLSNR